MCLHSHLQKSIILLSALACIGLLGCHRESLDDAVRLGQQSLRMGNYPQAIQHLSRAVQLKPSNPILHYNLGMAYLLSSDYKKAAKAFDTADRLDVEGNAIALEGLARARREMGDYEGAISAFERAFAKVNRRADLVAGMAVCEMEQGNMEYAKRNLDDALITDPHDAVALFNLAVLMQKPHFNDPQRAAELYARFLTSVQEHYPVEREKARSRLQEIHQQRTPELQLLIDDKIMEASTAKRPIDACLAAAQAVKLDESNPDAYWIFLQALQKAGKVREASLAQERFKLIFPHDPRAASLP